MRDYKRIYAATVIAINIVIAGCLCLPVILGKTDADEDREQYKTIVVHDTPIYNATVCVQTETKSETPELQEEQTKEYQYIDCRLTHAEQDFIYKTCKQYDVDYYLIMALIDNESKYNKTAVSKTGDYGLMQINECNHKRGLDYLDFETNITEGIKILSPLLHKYTTTNMALMAYNMGESGAAKCWNEGIYSSEYSKDIMTLYIQIKSEKEKEKQL